MGDAQGVAYSSNLGSGKRKSLKEATFEALLEQADVDLHALRTASWTRVPDTVRGKTWQLLLGYLPAKRDRRYSVIKEKRDQYFQHVHMYYRSGSEADRSEDDQKMLRQILLDIPRTNPGLPLFHCPEVRASFERMLYIYSIRHPASGYVQGMNDLVTPFYVVFLADQICEGNIEAVVSRDASTVDPEILNAVEADSYWSLTKLLDGIQDHYTMSQPGLQRMVYRLQGIIQRIDQPLYDHLEAQDVDFNQFAFRWMNNLLIRELELGAIVRLWDTNLAEEHGGFDSFHVYVCAALLVTWNTKLCTLNFQDLIVFLQDLPTRGWGTEEIEMLLGQAFILKSLFNESPSHLS